MGSLFIPPISPSHPSPLEGEPVNTILVSTLSLGGVGVKSKRQNRSGIA